MSCRGSRWCRARSSCFALRSAHLPDVRIEFAHTELSDVSQRIAAFRRGEADVLVATTVVECGIDIARANTIIIQEAVRTDCDLNAWAPNQCVC